MSPSLEINNIPVLTEIVARSTQLPPTEQDTLVAELQTKLAARAFNLAEEALRAALADVQASVFAQVSAKLRRELPELIDATLREHLGDRRG